MKALSNNKGLSYIDAVAWVIALAMILSLIINVALIMVAIQNAENNTKRVLDGFVTQNSQEIYDSLKNGQNSIYTFDADSFIEELKDELFLVERNSLLCYMDSNGNVLYRMTNPTVNYEVDNVLKLNVTYNIIMPIGYDNRTLVTLSIPQKVVAYYNLK